MPQTTPGMNSLLRTRELPLLPTKESRQLGVQPVEGWVQARDALSVIPNVEARIIGPPQQSSGQNGSKEWTGTKMGSVSWLEHKHC